MLEIGLIISKIVDILSDIRLNTERPIGFLQLGSHNGSSYDDVANKILEKDDVGTFIDANPNIINDLIQNKKYIINSKILNVAVIPNDNFLENRRILLDVTGGTSTFIKFISNKNEIFDNFEWYDPTLISVKDLVDEYIKYELDILLIDCEGYDHDLVFEFLKYTKPKLLYFESWDTTHINAFGLDIKLKTRSEVIELLKNKGYNFEFFEKSENILAYNIYG
jgi:hypothetical protein